MEPFFFESGGDRLFGSYHPAKDPFSRKGIVICPPIYAEYFRTYRYLRNLAEAWAQSGHHVLRFDYFGTGDSAGEWQDGGPDRWLADIGAAAQELQDISGSDAVCIAGVRLGAALSYLYASRSDGVEKILIWDPVIDGEAYIRSLEATHERLLDKANDRVKRKLARLENEFAGFRRAQWIDGELSTLKLANVAPGRLGSIVHVVSEPALESPSFIEHLTGKGVSVDRLVFGDDCDWGTPSEAPIQAFQTFEGLRQCL